MKSEYWTSSRIQRTFAYQETPAVVTDFNQPVEDYLNYIYTCLSAKMVKTVVDRAVNSDLGLSFKYCFNTN